MRWSLLLLVVGCATEPSLPQVDSRVAIVDVVIFQPERVDVLLVVDNSTAIDPFEEALDAAESRWRTTLSAVDAHVATVATATAQPLEAMRRAFVSPEFRALRRDDADLVVLIVSATDDESTDSVDAYAADVDAAKGSGLSLHPRPAVDLVVPEPDAHRLLSFATTIRALDIEEINPSYIDGLVLPMFDRPIVGEPCFDEPVIASLCDTVLRLYGGGEQPLARSSWRVTDNCLVVDPLPERLPPFTSAYAECLVDPTD